MADQHREEEKKEESLMDKIADKIHGHGSSSSSDSEDENPSSFKAKVYRLFGREKPVHRVLGGGKPADVFLWRDKKLSAGLLAGATAIWVLFDVLEYHLLSFVCHGLILVLTILFLWSNATTFIKKSRPHIPEVSIPEKPVIEFASALRIEVNLAFAALRCIASERDLKKFLCVIVGLWLLSVAGNCCDFLTLLYSITVLLFTVPLFYEKYEEQVDSFAEKAVAELKKQYAVSDAKVLSKIPRRPLKDKKECLSKHICRVCMPIITVSSYLYWFRMMKLVNYHGFSPSAAKCVRDYIMLTLSLIACIFLQEYSCCSFFLEPPYPLAES